MLVYCPVAAFVFVVIRMLWARFLVFREFSYNRLIVDGFSVGTETFMLIVTFS